MTRVILGTAGHIDHGKTALVRALTGVDTDRLKEEKARGITIELGFAELQPDEGPGIGVVDVPGHEAFVRTMVAGASGMDVVLLVVAADEGVMPQTREHVAILELLGVEELVVALTKCDLVDEEWVALVDDDVATLLEGTPYADAPRVPVSSETREGMDALTACITRAAGRAALERDDDLARLPVDRAFTVQGTGTVVTGTLWSGVLRTEDRIRILPGDREARVRGLQVHGRAVQEARGGDRTAVALSGQGIERGDMHRGAWLVADPAWQDSWMLTVFVRVLPDSDWVLEHNQRVRVHLGTAEVLARVAFLEVREALLPGERGWIQLRLEEPVVARALDHVVIRSYSPMVTVGGGIVAEPTPHKRRALDASAKAALLDLVNGTPSERLKAVLGEASWEGVERRRLPVLLGSPASECDMALAELEGDFIETASRVFGVGTLEEGRALMLAALDAEHEADSLRGEVPLSRLRVALPQWADARLADALIEDLAGRGALELVGGGARRPGFTPEATPEQEAHLDLLQSTYASAGLAAPTVPELPDAVGGRDDLWSLLRVLEGRGSLTLVADGLYMDTHALEQAVALVRSRLGGREGLGPSDFRDTLDVSRKHLIPLLNYLDGLGVTRREDKVRSVPSG